MGVGTESLCPEGSHVAARVSDWHPEGLSVGERRVPFYAGAMHYWRVPRAQWAGCLRQVHALGFTLVETYVPWREHESEQGAFAWSGDRDLAAFLTAARAAGLGVVIRPGPHVNAELTSFGIPDWVLAERGVQALTSRGTPAWLPVPPRAFPIPSYASRAFHVHVRAWYAAVAAIVEPFLGDPVVAIGVDNEAQMFFRSGAFDLDYHPDALVWWDETQPGVEPPRAWTPETAASCARWVEFKDHYLARALGEFATMLDVVGLGGLARFHNLPPGHHELYDLRAIQRAIGGPVGIDAYTPRSGFAELRRRAAACVGDASPIPIGFEVGVGFFPWLPPLDATDDPLRERDHLLTLLSQGIRGFNLFMAVERDRYYGAAISLDGNVEAAWIKPLLATLHELAWPALRRATPIAVIHTRADERHGVASCVIDPMTPVLADVLGLGAGGATELGLDPSAIASRKWQLAVCRALELAHVPFHLVDETATADELAAYRAVIVPTVDRISATTWATLHALAGRTICVIGPHTPARDAFDQPLVGPPPKRLGKLNPGSLADLPGLAEDLAALAGELVETWQVERPDDVRTTVFSDAAGRARALFVISDAARPVQATILADEGSSLRDAITGELVRSVDGRVTVSVHARGVRMFAIG
ncbi:MAG: alpha-amylase family protein [Kofleriaceae bacterium]